MDEMKAEYKRDLNHSYLILPGIKAVDTASYQIRMLMGNVIPKLLKCKIQGVDGKLLFSYEITSRQPLKNLFENKKFDMKSLQLVFSGFVEVMEEMAEFLLNPENLILLPEYIYVDMEKRELYFCYLPGYEKEVREQFQCLTEYILPKLDHEDSRAVMLGYGIYRRALEDSFHLEYVKEELYRTGEEKEIKTEFETEPINISLDEKKDIFQEITPELEKADNSFWRQDGKEKQESCKNTYDCVKKIVVCFIAALAILIAVVCKAFGHFPWLTVEGMIGALMALLGMGTLTLYISENWKKRKQSGKEEFKKEKKDMLQEKVKSVPTEAEKIEMLLKSQEKKNEEKQDTKILQECGETVILTANITKGPASLVSREPGELATIYLSDGITVIGKLESAADAVIPLPTVSRIHAKIRKREEEYFLCDLNSRNGTSVNGRMLKNEEEYCLQDEDEVDFAQARYIFLK